MVCDYAIVICPKTGNQCDHRNCMGDCARAKVSGIIHATFGDCLKIYAEHSEACKECKRKVLRNVRRSLDLLGMTEQTPVDALSYRRAKELEQKLMQMTYRGRKVTAFVVSHAFAAFRSITSESLRDYFDELGFARPIFDFPTIKEPKKKVVAMTQEQDCEVDVWMRHLSESPDPIEQRMFVALWFERLFGMRPGDINRLTWNCIRFDGSVTKLVYKPHKTEKCPGRDDPIIIPPKLWAWVKPFYVLGGKLIPPIRKTRVVVGNNRAIWDRINKWYRAHGICDYETYGKASYINRRQRITEAFDKDGLRGASAIGKNTPKVQMNHYIAVGEYAA